MKIINRIDSLQSKSRIIEKSISGYWESDIWDFKSKKLNEYNPKEFEILGCFDFTEFPKHIKEEVKYFLICKMEDKLLTMGSMYNTSRIVNLIKEFLTQYYQNISSFTEISHEKGLMQWRTFLIEKGYKVNEKCNNQLNPCLICSNMCTSSGFIHEFEEEIDITKKQIERAKVLGRDIWVEKNQTVLERLEAIVGVLKDGKVYHRAGKHRREYIGDERNHVKYN